MWTDRANRRVLLPASENWARFSNTLVDFFGHLGLKYLWTITWFASLLLFLQCAFNQGASGRLSCGRKMLTKWRRRSSDEDIWRTWLMGLYLWAPILHINVADHMPQNRINMINKRGWWLQLNRIDPVLFPRIPSARIPFYLFSLLFVKHFSMLLKHFGYKLRKLIIRMKKCQLNKDTWLWSAITLRPLFHCSINYLVAMATI